MTVASPATLPTPAPNPMAALQGLAWRLLCQPAGEGIARLGTAVGTAAELLLTHLSLLFVPVGVGVMTHLGLLSAYGGPILLAITLSTWIGLAVTAFVLRALLPATSPESGA